VLLDLVGLAVLEDAALKGRTRRRGKVRPHSVSLFLAGVPNMAVRAVESLVSIVHADLWGQAAQRAQADRAGLKNKGGAVRASPGDALSQDREGRLVAQRPKGMIGNPVAPLRMSRV
jgi:hypothetical protein